MTLVVLEAGLHVRPTKSVLLLPPKEMQEQSSCGCQKSGRQREICLKVEAALEIAVKSKHAHHWICGSPFQETMFDPSRGFAGWVLIRKEKKRPLSSTAVL